MKLRQIIVLVIFLIINGLILAVLFMGPEDKEEEDKKKSSIQYFEATTVKNGVHIDHISSYGKITGAMAFDLSSEVRGKLLKGDVTFKPGVKFRKGQVICRVDNTDALYSLSARKSSFITLIANALPDIKLDFPKEYDKWLDYMTSLTLNRPIPTLPGWNSDQEKVFLASRNIISEYFGIKGNENTISKYVLVAPFSGMIQTTFANIHSNVTPGARLATLVETNNFELQAPFQMGEMRYVEKGDQGVLTDNDGREIGTAIVDRISDVVNQNTQSVDVYMKVIPHNNEYFYEGMFANLRMRIDSIPNSFELPRRAVNVDSVYLLQDSSLVRKHVSVERKKSNSIIVKGLNDGEMVVISRVENYVDTLKAAPIVR